MAAALRRAFPWRAPVPLIALRLFRRSGGLIIALALSLPAAAEPLHLKVDAAMDAARPGPPAPASGDAEFLRRASLTLTGMPPAAAEARAFMADAAPDKRAKLIGQLTGSGEFIRHLTVQLDVMLMERRAEMHTKSADWRRWLEESLAAGKPWDQLVREILANDGSDEKSRPVARWMLERQGEPNLLTRDAGRLFLGRDMACAQCHDHPRIDDYFQRDYHGLLGFFGRTWLFQPDPKNPAIVAEQAAGETAWNSVFTKVTGASRPRLPGGREIEEPVIAETEKWTVAPVEKDKNVRPIPKYSRRARLIEGLVRDNNFRRNIANRLWGMVMGRCLVDPPDAMHSGNPPAHPAVLDLLGEEIATMKFDLRGFVHELALTKTFALAFDPAPVPAGTRDVLAAKLPAMEPEATRLKEESARLGVAFTECSEAFEKIHHAAQPAITEWNKACAAHTDAAKAAAAATDALQKAEEKKRTLPEAVAKLRAAAEAGTAACLTAPDDKEIAAASKTFQDKLAKVTAETEVNEKELPAKKAAAETRTKEADAARQAADAKKPSADESAKQLADAMEKLTEADAAKQKARVAAQQAAQRLKEAEALLTYTKAVEASAVIDGEEAAMKAVAFPVSLDDARESLAAVAGRTFGLTTLTPLAPEPLCWSILKVTGAMEQIRESAFKEWDEKNKPTDADKADPAKQAARNAGIEALAREKVKPHEEQFVRLFANSAGQPQNDFFATADQVLYFENAGSLRGWANPSGNNLAARLTKLKEPKEVADELYLSVLTRLPSADEVNDVAAVLSSRPPEQRAAAISDAVWALLTTTEFRFCH